MTTTVQTIEPVTIGEQLPAGPLLGEIYVRLGQIMADVPAIPKEQKNVQQNYAFRGIDDVFNALHGLFAKHGVVILPEVLKAEYVQQLAGANQNLATDARLLVRYHFVAGDGSSVSMTCQGESRDYADKATNQALSGAFKAGLLQMFLIPLEGMPEQDKESPTIEDPLTPEQVHERQRNAVKVSLVEILDSTKSAEEFWQTHQGMTLDDLVAAAHQKVADDMEAGDSTPEPEMMEKDMPAVGDPAAELLSSLVLGKVPARKTLLQQGISDMERLGTSGDWLGDQLGEQALTDLEVKDLKVLYAALQKELTSG